MDNEKAMSQSESSSLPNGIGLAPWLRMKQEGMTENESRIVEWLLTPGNLSDAPAIKDVAEALSVSEAMIVKVSKLLGFSGFRNLRSALEAYFSQSEQVLPTELSFDEAPQDVVNKVFNITLRTIMEGQSIVNVDEIHRAARFFAQANQRDLYGAGGSNAICADVQHKFLRIGVRCQAYPGRAYHDDVRLAAEGRRCGTGGLALRAHQRYQIGGGAGEKERRKNYLYHP
ncbi:transcriptional regulator of D-allose utilization [Klebsiella grimontii]|uniref:Transcriptional regulator of D-allose utilization n=1 Tax=Klebsiella grimontii TaxID=2058152 RepID=A0A7H4PBT7_9ENTR|nr:transcriptional regulator of D-allose utilization [Klebsiella grimontii]